MVVAMLLNSSDNLGIKIDMGADKLYWQVIFDNLAIKIDMGADKLYLQIISLKDISCSHSRTGVISPPQSI